jgi:hypothetical protein
VKLIILSTLLFLLSFKAFSFDIEEARQINNTSSHINGPNCWNSALKFKGLLPNFRQTLPAEWRYQLKNHCNEVDIPSIGDIGRVQALDGTEVHGFIYIDEAAIFQKLGEDKQHPYQLVSFEKMLKQYGRTRACRGRQDFSQECHHLIKYYSCAKKIESVNTLILEIEENFEEFLFSKKTKWHFKDDCFSQSFLKRNELLDSSTSLLDQLQKNQLNTEESIRLESIKYQFNVFKVGTRNFGCRSEKEIREKSYKAFKASIDRLML